MALTPQTVTLIDQALAAALGREVVSSALGSRELSELLGEELRARAVFSARTTNTEYLQALRSAIERALAGGRDNDLPQLKLELRELLARLKYTPEKGFAGDEALGVPPAEPHSLRDLGSEKRLNLILDTEIKKHRGVAQKLRGQTVEALELFPAWELVRVQTRRVPRGLPGSGSLGWQRRWFEVGAPMNAAGRLVALKTDPVWQKLGSKEYFDDALDLDHPPFAFRSGMGWRGVSRAEALALGLDVEAQDATAGVQVVAESENSLRRIDPDLRASLLGKIAARRGGESKSVRYQSLLARELEKAKEGGVL